MLDNDQTRAVRGDRYVRNFHAAERTLEQGDEYADTSYIRSRARLRHRPLNTINCWRTVELAGVPISQRTRSLRDSWRFLPQLAAVSENSFYRVLKRVTRDSPCTRRTGGYYDRGRDDRRCPRDRIVARGFFRKPDDAGVWGSLIDRKAESEVGDLKAENSWCYIGCRRVGSTRFRVLYNIWLSAILCEGK